MTTEAREVQAVVDFVVYDPENEDTYPSVCQDAETVKDRFGFTGGEWLVFTTEGTYLGHLTQMIDHPDILIGE